MIDPYRTAPARKAVTRPTISGKRFVIAFVIFGVVFIRVMILLCAR